jgi:hypothetical protein
MSESPCRNLSEAGDAVDALLEHRVHREQRRRRHEAAAERGVRADHGVLHGVAQEHDENEVGDGQLRDLGLAEQPYREHDEKINCDGAQHY